MSISIYKSQEDAIHKVFVPGTLLVPSQREIFGSVVYPDYYMSKEMYLSIKSESSVQEPDVIMDVNSSELEGVEDIDKYLKDMSKEQFETMDDYDFVGIYSRPHLRKVKVQKEHLQDDVIEVNVDKKEIATLLLDHYLSIRKMALGHLVDANDSLKNLASGTFLDSIMVDTSY